MNDDGCDIRLNQELYKAVYDRYNECRISLKLYLQTVDEKK